MKFSRRTLLAAGLAAGCATEPPMPTLNVFELRNYVMQPGGRDVLIEMFEAHFYESQEAVGSHIVGIFRNLDDPNSWVWMRAFENMDTRRAALDAFYTSPIWREHREAANAAMIDSSNVLLLRPRAAPSLIHASPAPAPRPTDALIVARTYALTPQTEADFAALYAREATPRLRALGAVQLATFATEHAANSYPRLPIREGETVFVSLTRFETAAAFEAQRAALAEVDASILSPLAAAPQIMRLAPTLRSRLR